MDGGEDQNKTQSFFTLTTREMLGMGVLVLIGICSFFAWRSFSHLMLIGDAVSLWEPVFWFVLFTILFLFGTILWTRKLERLLGAILLPLIGLFYFQSWEYVVVGLIAGSCFFSSSHSVAREGRDRIHFHFYRSLRSGSFFCILGLSLLLSSAYYVSLKASTWEELVPRFRIGEGMTKVVLKVAGMIQPSFAELSEGDQTVDEFLLSFGESNLDSGAPLPTENLGQEWSFFYPEINQFLSREDMRVVSSQVSSQIAEKMYLENGRRQIAALIGRNVSGDERISDVLTIALQNKFITSLSGGQGSERVPSQAIPFFLSLLLFLTLLPLATIFVPVCILTAYLLFLAGVSLGWLRLEKVMTEQERLAL